MLLRKFAAAVICLVVLMSLGAGAAASASPAATFQSPSAATVSVLQTGSYTIKWSEVAAQRVSARTIVVQAAATAGSLGCDSRWVPVSSTSVTGTMYVANKLPTNRCIRFLLVLSTASGRQTIYSRPVIVAPAGFGPTVDFTNPFVDGVVSYETADTIAWVERDTLGSRIVSRGLVEESGPAVGDSCAGVTWGSRNAVTFTGSSVARTLKASYCYRYRMTLSDALGYSAERVSGALRVAHGLPEWTGMLDLYRPAAFASQATMTWCVAASTEMMINLVLGRGDVSSSSQGTYIAYAQGHDGGSYSYGSDPAGWAAALTRYGGGTYAVATFGTSSAAIKTAALRMRLTNRPVGLLVMHGGHAWVISGFLATADPATTDNYTVTAIFVEGPLYPRPANVAGYDLRPDTSLTLVQLGKYFTTYYDPVVRTWNGKFVLILP